MNESAIFKPRYSPSSAILPAPRRTMAEHKHSFILNLPNEVLVRILELVAACDEFTVSIPYTCRRFYQLGISFQYQSIRLGVNYFMTPLQLKLTALHRTFQENPMMGQYCHDLRVTFNDCERHRDFNTCITIDLRILKDITFALSNVRSLNLKGGFHGAKSERTQGFIRGCVNSMQSLQKVSLRRHTPHDLELYKVIDTLQNTSIGSLSIEGVQFPSQSRSFWKSRDYGPSNITDLDVSDYDEGRHGTAYLLQWPKALTSLRFGSLRNNPFYFDLPMIGRMLKKHKHTLVKLSIGCLTNTGAGKLMDFSKFTILEELDLVMWQIVPKWDSHFEEKDYISLLAPKLRVFRVRFSDLKHGSWHDFEKPAQSWLRGFAEVAARRKIPLREIAIYFNPDIRKGYRKHSYPWDLMDALDEELRPKGIAVTYNTPVFSRQDWLMGDEDDWLEAAYADCPNAEDEFPDLQDI